MQSITREPVPQRDGPAESNKLQFSKKLQSTPDSPTNSVDSGHAQAQASDASCSSSDSNDQMTSSRGDDNYNNGDNNSISDQVRYINTCCCCCYCSSCALECDAGKGLMSNRTNECCAEVCLTASSEAAKTNTLQTGSTLL